MLCGRGFDLCIAGHVLTLRIHWRKYP
jgi:hypothetical protein